MITRVKRPDHTGDSILCEVDTATAEGVATVQDTLLRHLRSESSRGWGLPVIVGRTPDGKNHRVNVTADRDGGVITINEDLSVFTDILANPVTEPG